jgi:hypothetical protein
MTIIINYKKIINNCDICSKNDHCSLNLCPLDIDLELRHGSKQDKCRYMRGPKRAMIAGREFISGGAIMPSVPLNFVPQRNLAWLNKASQQQWRIVHDN